jgi:hypothetical protein
MHVVQIPSRLMTSVFAAATAAVLATTAQADVEIQFTGVDLVYDGASFYDAGATTGGLGDPADADALASVDFFNNNILVGSLDSDIWLDVFIPDVTGIPDAPGTVHNFTTPGNPGFFDLLIGTSPLASEFLILDLDSVNITYVDIAGLAQFTFGASISPSYAQNLPFGLTIVGPVTVSFSAQVDSNSITSAGGFITGFNASGTGEYTAIPAPASVLLLGIGALVGVRRRRAA